MIHKVISMEKILRQTLLYDFYGELLTGHQRRLYEDAVFGDLSLSEIAEMQGISRQGVHDLIRRCDRALEEYEEKLHLVRKFSETRRQIEKIRSLAGEGGQEAISLSGPELSGRLEQIRTLCDRVLASL